MIVHANPHWRITSDPEQWIVQKRRMVKGQPRWDNLSYHTTLDSAVVWLAHKRIRLMGGTYGPDTLPVLCQALDRLHADTVDLLADLERQVKARS